MQSCNSGLGADLEPDFVFGQQHLKNPHDSILGFSSVDWASMFALTTAAALWLHWLCDEEKKKKTPQHLVLCY